MRDLSVRLDGDMRVADEMWFGSDAQLANDKRVGSGMRLVGRRMLHACLYSFDVHQSRGKNREFARESICLASLARANHGMEIRCLRARTSCLTPLACASRRGQGRQGCECRR